jgi:uncharacterized protein YndB with AHSA1/START domain
MPSPNGGEFGGTDEHLEITPPVRLVFTWTWDGHDGHEDTQLAEVEFIGHADETTTVALTNRELRDEEPERLPHEGWRLSFDNLGRVLAE